MTSNFHYKPDISSLSNPQISLSFWPDPESFSTQFPKFGLYHLLLNFLKPCAVKPICCSVQYQWTQFVAQFSKFILKRLKIFQLLESIHPIGKDYSIISSLVVTDLELKLN